MTEDPKAAGALGGSTITDRPRRQRRLYRKPKYPTERRFYLLR